MKILFLARYLPQDGATTHMYTLAKKMIKKGHEVHLISAGPTRQEGAINMLEQAVSFGLIHHKVDMPLYPQYDFKGKIIQLFKYICVTPGTINTIHKINPDIIHVHYPVTSYIAKLYCILFKNKFIMTYHITTIPKHILHKKADYVIAISKELEKELLERYKYDKNKISLINNGVSKEKFNQVIDISEKEFIKSEKGIPKDKIIIGFVGSLIKRKGIDILLEACSLLEDNEIHIVLLGDGDNEWVMDMVNKFNLEERITIYPFGDPIDYYKIFDIFVLPSRIEGFGLVVIEAMMMGIPVIRSNTEGAYDQILHMKDGFIFRNEDTEELSRYIDMLIKDSELRKEIGENGRKKAINNFSDDIMVQKTLDLYKKVNQGGRF